MRMLYRAADVLATDRKTMDVFALPSLVLMEEAVQGAVRIMEEKLHTDSTVLTVAGSGNNGADALALARVLYTRGYRNIEIFMTEGRQTDENRIQLEICRRIGIPFTQSITGHDVLIDGFLGAGLKGSPREDAVKLIDKINSTRFGCVFALDVPSGIGDESDCKVFVKADEVITFGLDKKCLHTPGAHSAYMHLHLVPLSYPEVPDSSTVLHSLDEYRPLRLKANDYKVSRGRVAVIGGSRDYVGAVRLAAKAAFKAGAGMVTVFTDEAIIDLVSLDCGASVMVRPFEDFFSLSSGYDSVLIGPGLGMGEGRRELVEKVCSLPLKRLILDADAIRLFSGSSKAEETIMTPHPGEYRALEKTPFTTPDEFYASLIRTAERTGATIVYKAESVYIARDGMVDIVEGLNPALGVAGSGDVLAGIMTSSEVLDAVLLHQMAGRGLADEKGFFSSDELLDTVGEMR